MRNRAPSIAAWASCLLLAPGCSPSPSDQTGAATPQAAATVAGEQDNPGPATVPATTVPAATLPAAVATDAAQPQAPTAREVPLTPGIYVVDGENCRNPANAGWRGWDGDGLVGSSTRDCRATIVSRSGDDYTLRNSCENTYDGSRSDETFVMTVTDQVHFAIKGNRFGSCSMAQVPAALREHVFGRVTADTPINSENYAQVMEARSRAYDRLEYKPVSLNGFECGDNCYLEFTEAVEGAAPRKLLCTARLCANWQGAGRLPPALRNTGATVKFGRADQVDGAGTVMARGVDAVVDLRLATGRQRRPRP